MTRLHDLSLETADIVFRMKLEPILTYGLACYAQYLSTASLLELDRAKHYFIKRTLAVPRSTRTELCYRLTKQKRFAKKQQFTTVNKEVIVYTDEVD